MNFRNHFVLGRFGRVILTTKDGDKNMLRVAVWQELRLLDELIQNMTVYYDDQYFTYQEICAKWLTDCFQNDILNLDYIMEDVSCHFIFLFAIKVSIYYQLKFRIFLKQILRSPWGSKIFLFSLIFFCFFHRFFNLYISTSLCGSSCFVLL